MKIRCDLHVNGGARKLLLVPGATETGEHLALKLAAYLLFWDFDPVVGASSKHPALADQEFIPDLMALDEGGAVRLWVECGNVAWHKLNKLVRRCPGARLVVLKSTHREAGRLRADVDEKLGRSERLEILSWPDGGFSRWLAALGEKTEAYGEAGGRSFNLVVNETPFDVDLLAV